MLLNRLLDETLAPSLTAEMVGEGVRVSTRAIPRPNLYLSVDVTL